MTTRRLVLAGMSAVFLSGCSAAPAARATTSAAPSVGPTAQPAASLWPAVTPSVSPKPAAAPTAPPPPPPSNVVAPSAAADSRSPSFDLHAAPPDQPPASDDQAPTAAADSHGTASDPQSVPAPDSRAAAASEPQSAITASDSHPTASAPGPDIAASPADARAGAPAAERQSASVVASATVSSPSTRPALSVTKEATADRSVTLLQQFDAELNRLIHDEPAAEPFAGVASDERHLLEAVIDALTDFRRALKDDSSLLATKSAPLLNLAERVRDEIPLTLPTLALCRSATQFGVYDAFEPARFTAGRETPVIIYCEVDHFRSTLAPADNRWETRLSYEAVLYRDGEHPIAVTNKKPTNIIDRCRNKRRDFFLADRLTLPADLPVGKYLLKVTVIDQSANHVAEKSVPLLIAPN